MIILELVGQGALRGQLPCLASRQSDVEHSSRLGVSSDGHAIHQLRTNRTFEIESREWGGISRGSDSMVSLLAVQIYVYIYMYVSIEWRREGATMCIPGMSVPTLHSEILQHTGLR